jgi:hypothetical protein
VENCLLLPESVFNRYSTGSEDQRQESFPRLIAKEIPKQQISGADITYIKG